MQVLSTLLVLLACATFVQASPFAIAGDEAALEKRQSTCSSTIPTNIAAISMPSSCNYTSFMDTACILACSDTLGAGITVSYFTSPNTTTVYSVPVAPTSQWVWVYFYLPNIDLSYPVNNANSSGIGSYTVNFTASATVYRHQATMIFGAFANMTSDVFSNSAISVLNANNTMTYKAGVTYGFPLTPCQMNEICITLMFDDPCYSWANLQLEYQNATGSFNVTSNYYPYMSWYRFIGQAISAYVFVPIPPQNPVTQPLYFMQGAWLATPNNWTTAYNLNNIVTSSNNCNSTLAKRASKAPPTGCKACMLASSLNLFNVTSSNATISNSTISNSTSLNATTANSASSNSTTTNSPSLNTTIANSASSNSTTTNSPSLNTTTSNSTKSNLPSVNPSSH